MMRLIGRITGLTCLVLIGIAAAWADDGSASRRINDDRIVTDTVREATYFGKPVSYWVKCIRDRDRDEMQIAFDAIRFLGPDAWLAIPELTSIVEAPFDPIRIGVDRDGLVLSKLDDIELRANAIEALGAIGEAASTSAPAMIRWAMMSRVIPENLSRRENNELFIDLVAIDVLHRMRVAGAIAEFGRDAYPVAAALLTSPNDEERKLAVAILSEHVLPIATELLKSPDCENQMLGTAILGDMAPVMPKEHLMKLKSSMACDTN